MVLEGLKCVRCMHELNHVESIELDEEGIQHYLECPFCGAKFEIVEPSEDEKKNYEFWKDQDISLRLDEIDIMNGRCLNCGGKVGVTGNFMLSDYDEEVGDEDDKMNFVLSTCDRCGCSEVRWDTSENDHKLFPSYWNEDNQEKQENKDEK